MSIRETIVVNPKYENFRPLLESLSHGDPTDERSSALLTHYVTEAEGVQVAIACFPRPSLWQRIVRLGRKSKAHAAFDNALHLQTLGIATPSLSATRRLSAEATSWPVLSPTATI